MSSSFSLYPNFGLCHTWCNISSMNINSKVDPQPIINIKRSTILFCARINKSKGFYYKVFKIVSQTSITVTNWILIEISKLQNNWLDWVSEFTSKLLRISYHVWVEKLLAKKQSRILTFEHFHVIYFLVLIKLFCPKSFLHIKDWIFHIHAQIFWLLPLFFLKMLYLVSLKNIAANFKKPPIAFKRETSSSKKNPLFLIILCDLIRTNFFVFVFVFLRLLRSFNHVPHFDILSYVLFWNYLRSFSVPRCVIFCVCV